MHRAYDRSACMLNERETMSEREALPACAIAVWAMHSNYDRSACMLNYDRSACVRDTRARASGGGVCCARAMKFACVRAAEEARAHPCVRRRRSVRTRRTAARSRTRAGMHARTHAQEDVVFDQKIVDCHCFYIFEANQ